MAARLLFCFFFSFFFFLTTLAFCHWNLAVQYVAVLLGFDLSYLITRRWRDLLYEIHGDGIPRLLRNQKLLEKSVGFVAHRFGMGTSGARFAVVLDIDWNSRPIVLHADLMKGLRLTEMTCKGMVMRVLENT